MLTEEPMKGKRKEAIVATRSTASLLVLLLAGLFTLAIIAYLTSKPVKPKYHINQMPSQTPICKLVGSNLTPPPRSVQGIALGSVPFLFASGFPVYTFSEFVILCHSELRSL